MKTSITALVARLVLMMMLVMSTGCSMFMSFVARVNTTRTKPIPADSPELTKRLEEMKRAKRTSRYALIICGDCYDFTNTVATAYWTLLALGYQARDIFILSNTGESSLYPADGMADKKRVKEVMSAFSSLTLESSLFVYVSDHGKQLKYENSEDTVSTIVLLQDFEELTEDEFTDLAEAILAGRQVYLFDQCYGAGFVKSLRARAERSTGKSAEARPEIVAMAVAPPDRLAANVGWPLAFFKALFLANRSGQVLSIAEAYTYAGDNDQNTRSGNNRPLMFESKPGAADHGL